MKIISISTYVPQKCGIATYSRDLIHALVKHSDNTIAHVAAVNSGVNLLYPHEVKIKFNRDECQEYIKLADRLNKSDYDLVMIQHEYGIFGGQDGNYILEFARRLKKPFVTTFHTTLLEPGPNQMYVLKELANLSVNCIVMIKEAMRRLISIYNIPNKKIKVIHHGVPDVELENNVEAKIKLGFEANDFLIGTINLISRNKGLEFAIEAVHKAARHIPQVKFLMVGTTHPQVKRKEGENYRDRKSVV